MHLALDLTPLIVPSTPFLLLFLPTRYLRYSPEVAGFREKYVHNDVLFSIVDEVTQKLGGESWQNLMKRYILGVCISVCIRSVWTFYSCILSLIRYRWSLWFPTEERRSEERIKHAVGTDKDHITTVRKRKLRWYRHITITTRLAKMMPQDMVQGGRRKGRQKKRLEDRMEE